MASFAFGGQNLKTVLRDLKARGWPVDEVSKDEPEEGEPTTSSKEWCLWRVAKAQRDGDPLPRTKEALAIWVEPLLTEAASRPGSFLQPAKVITIQTGYFKHLAWRAA